MTLVSASITVWILYFNPFIMNDSLVHSGNTVSQISTFFDIGRVNEMYKLAQNFHAANCWGPDVKNPAQALVKIQAGFEMGMAPVEAMNSLYIVNGKITIWGSAMTKRLREHGWKIEYEEKLSEATVTISKGQERYSYTATMDELKKIKSRAAEFAGKDKLKWHAISRLIRFHVPEVLGAGVAYLQEEIIDAGEPSVSVVEQKSESSELANPAYDQFCSAIEQVKTRKEYWELRDKIKDVQWSAGESEAIKEAMLDAWQRLPIEAQAEAEKIFEKKTVEEAEEIAEQSTPPSTNKLKEAVNSTIDEQA